MTLEMLEQYDDMCLEAKMWEQELDELREMRGKWIRNNIDNPAFFICSRCGIIWYNETNYCPNCGAKMDLKEES